VDRSIADIEAEIRALQRPDQERLLRALLEELDGPAHEDADVPWLEEVQRRSAELDAGLVQTKPAEDVFERTRQRLKQ
jgi:putative addiction module component (TIGR02574 family)